MSASALYSRVLHITVGEMEEFANNNDLAHDEDYKRLDSEAGRTALFIIWAQSQYVPDESRAMLGQEREPGRKPLNARRLAVGRAGDRRNAGHKNVSDSQFESEQRRIVTAAIRFGFVEEQPAQPGPKPLVGTHRLHTLMARFHDEWIPRAIGVQLAVPIDRDDSGGDGDVQG